MARSTPSSPEPSSYRGNKGTNKLHTDTSSPGVLHLPQVKCLQKLPQMSPKIRKLFSLKNKRSDQGLDPGNSNTIATDTLKQDSLTLEGTRSNKSENGIISPVKNLDIIPEKEHSDTEADNTSSNTRLADLVLSLFKNGRQLGYKSVNSEEKDIESELCDIAIDNMSDITADSCDKALNNAFIDKNINMDIGKKSMSSEKLSGHVLMKDVKSARRVGRRGDVGSNNLSTLNPPKIILTYDTDLPSR